MGEREFLLSKFWRPTSIKDYKIHFARWNRKEQPLHAFVRGMEPWSDWQRTYPGRNEFNRPYIFSLMQMPTSPDLWMFGGIWDVNGIRTGADGKKHYDVEQSNQLAPLVGRLKLHRVHKGRGTRLKLERHYEQFVVSEVLSALYTGRSFPGYGSVNVNFSELEALIQTGA